MTSISGKSVIATESVPTDRPIEDVLDALGDPYARDVLIAVCRSARSAKELGDEVDHSIQTVYRRLELLEEAGLLRARTQVARDGNRYKLYESAFDSVLVSVDDEYDLRIYRQEDTPGRFAGVWKALARGSRIGLPPNCNRQ